MTERKSAPNAVYEAMRRDVYRSLDEAVDGAVFRGDVYRIVSKAVWLDVYGAMCGAMYNEGHEKHTYADDFIIHCRHTE
jgi:hypothetical protein